jgi:hypothetical protein
VLIGLAVVETSAHHGAHQAKSVFIVEVLHVVKVFLPGCGLLGRDLAVLLSLIQPFLVPIKHLLEALSQPYLRWPRCHV